MKNGMHYFLSAFCVIGIIVLFIIGRKIYNNDKTTVKVTKDNEISIQAPFKNNFEMLYYSPTTHEVIGMNGCGSSSGAYTLHYRNYVLYYEEDEGFYYYNDSNFKTHISDEDIINAR